jgi:uncharacterized protein
MLLRFEVTNHRSICAPVELSMVALDGERPEARRSERLDESVLAVAGIYGPNASGKSNVLDALSWLADSVRDSFRTWEGCIPRSPFRFGDGPSLPTSFEIEVLIGDVRYAYQLSVDDEKVLTESLHFYPHGRRNMLFERVGSELSTGRDFRATAGIRTLLAPRTLVVSSALRLSHPTIEPFGKFMSAIRNVTPVTARSSESAASVKNWFDEKASALKLFRFADLGIEDVVYSTNGEGRPKPVFRHSAGTAATTFELDDESIGTRVWFVLVHPLLAVLEHGGILLFDELDASLHPTLSARVVEMFQDPRTNPRNAQLIFSSHDTSLLNVLNRDEVWLTEKDASGATSLTALAEYKLRKDQNIERSYVQGRFGAIPDLDRFMLFEALGLRSSSDA